MKAVPTDEASRKAGPDCFSCRHLFITYEPQFPYGCRAVGFKSRGLPSREMVINSGIDCQFFSRKAGRAE